MRNFMLKYFEIINICNNFDKFKKRHQTTYI